MIWMQQQGNALLHNKKPPFHNTARATASSSKWVPACSSVLSAKSTDTHMTRRNPTNHTNACEPNEPRPHINSHSMFPRGVYVLFSHKYSRKAGSSTCCKSACTTASAAAATPGQLTAVLLYHSCTQHGQHHKGQPTIRPSNAT